MRESDLDLNDLKWEKMETTTHSDRVNKFFQIISDKVKENWLHKDSLKVAWLSLTLFFIVGGYWLLRSLKDPIISAINGVEYIPQAKIVSLILVFLLVLLYNYAIDRYSKHHVFYCMGAGYGILFIIIGFFLLHPIYGLDNIDTSPDRLLGWISFCSIESFGSLVIQCYWALVNSSVDTTFAKKNFGYIIAGAQIGSILGPTIATQSHIISIPYLYVSAAFTIFAMVAVMYYYIENYGISKDIIVQSGASTDENTASSSTNNNTITTTSMLPSSSAVSFDIMNDTPSSRSQKINNTNTTTSDNIDTTTITNNTIRATTGTTTTTNTTTASSSSTTNNTIEQKVNPNGGMLEGFYLFFEYDYVKGIFAISSFSVIQITIIDYMMKILAMSRYNRLHPDDPQAALIGFATFMGYFGQITNTISFLFSLFGTKYVIQHFGFSYTLLAYPTLLILCTITIWSMPTIWTIFSVMMVIKGMSYSLNNPTKEILYQRTSTNIKFKCKSWIDTFGQRSASAIGSVITNQFAYNFRDLTTYGSVVGLFVSFSLLYISRYMGKEFEVLSQQGIKVGDSDYIPSYDSKQRRYTRASSSTTTDDNMTDTSTHTQPHTQPHTQSRVKKGQNDDDDDDDNNNDMIEDEYKDNNNKEGGKYDIDDDIESKQSPTTTTTTSLLDTFLNSTTSRLQRRNPSKTLTSTPNTNINKYGYTTKGSNTNKRKDGEKSSNSNNYDTLPALIAIDEEDDIKCSKEDEGQSPKNSLLTSSSSSIGISTTTTTIQSAATSSSSSSQKNTVVKEAVKPKKQVDIESFAMSI